MVKALFFDLTDTLQEFDWTKQWSLLIDKINLVFNSNINEEELRLKYQSVYEVYRLGRIKSDFDFWGIVLRELAFVPLKNQVNELSNYNLEIRKQFTWLPKDYEKTLTELKKHFILAVVSSGVWPWGDYDFEKIFGFKINKHFDLIVNSYEEGYLKDSGELFKIALKKLNLKSKEAAFVGNSYQDDVLIAKKFGLKTIFLNKKDELKGEADLEIKKLSDLVEIISDLKNL